MKSRWTPLLVPLFPMAFWGLVTLILKGPVWLVIGLGVAVFVVALVILSCLVVGKRSDRRL